RERAWAEFQRQGLPDITNEVWKYTSLHTLEKANWVEPTEASELPTQAQDVIRAFKAQFDIAVLINGRIQKRHSRLSMESGYEFPARNGTPDMDLQDGFVSMAAAANTGGYQLRVAPGIRFPKPILLLHIQHGASSWLPTLNQINLSEGSEIQLAEFFLGSQDS